MTDGTSNRHGARSAPLREDWLPTMNRSGFNQFVLGSDAMTASRRLDSFAVLDAYVGGGGTVLDTARVYEDSELVIAEWLRANDPAGDLHLITKGGHPDNDWRPRLRETEIMRDAETSLKRPRFDAAPV